MPWPPSPDVVNAETVIADPTSIYRLYQRLLRLRRAEAALHRGTHELVDAPDGVVAYRRADGDDRFVIAVNFTADPVPLPAGSWTDHVVELASDGAGEGVAFSGTLGPDQAVVLRAPETMPGSSRP